MSSLSSSTKRNRFSPPDVPSLISSLRSLEQKQKKLVNSHVHLYDRSGAFRQSYDRSYFNGNLDGSDVEEQGNGDEGRCYITSYKMAEHHYRRKDCPFPTLARGLFVARTDYGSGVVGEGAEGAEEEEEMRIVGRGYDKFFNLDEVEYTTWKSLTTHTSPPYSLTYKSNGCLILISALDEGTLMVASKHSLGTEIWKPEIEEEGGKEGEKDEGEGNEETKILEEKVLQVERAVQELEIKAEPTRDLSDPTSGAIEGKPPSKSAQKKAAKLAFLQQKKEQAAAQASIPGSRAPEEIASNTKTSMIPHAAMGRKWLKIHLDRVGRTERDLARELYGRGVSCVLELCDDEFEEHVLATPEHLTGLHLHGLNHNTPHFSTLPPEEVADFARQWGFIPTATQTLQTIEEVRSYADKVAKEGKWNGDPIEGFVVRTTVRPGVEEDGSEPPYPPGSPFFFKIKFDEPYLMYRQWREITRTLLPLTSPGCKGRTNRNAEPWTKLGSKLKRPESKCYADWVAREMIANPGLFEKYDTGIVRVREAFLAWTRADGAEEWGKARENSIYKEKTEKRKLLIVPVAIPGMGKTVLGEAVRALLGGEMVHVQSDDVKTKKTGPAFLKAVVDALKASDIVFADRNNHLPQHHEELSDLSDSPALSGYNIHKLALVFDVDHHPTNKTLRIASERIALRGENHQSLRPDPTDQQRHENIVKRFQSEFVPPEGGVFDEECKLGVMVGLRENLGRVVKAIWGALGRDVPGAERLDEALAVGLKYKAELKKPLQGEVSKPARYYGLSVEVELDKVSQSALAGLPGDERDETRTDGETFLNRLIDYGRLTGRPHITIVHESSVVKEKESRAEGDSTIGKEESIWNACQTLGQLPVPTRFDFEITGLIWNDRVMTLVVERLRPCSAPHTSDQDQSAEAAKEVEKVLCESLADVLHVTVGTRDEKVPPFEARGLVMAWREGVDVMPDGGGRVRYAPLNDFVTMGRVVGLN